MDKETLEKINSALDSEITGFDRFMTAKKVNGRRAETLPDREIKRIEEILEKPIPERFIQEKLLEKHIEE